MSTATELGIVSIDADRALQIEVSAELGDVVSRTLAVIQPLDKNGKPLPAAEVRKYYKSKEALAMGKLVSHLAVNDEESYLRVGGLVKEAAKALGDIAADIKDDKKRASDLHTSLCDREFIAQFPHSLVKQAGDANINAYRMRQEQERREQQRKDTEAAQAEQRRLQAEADAKLREQQRLEQVAREAKRAGDMATARIATQEAALVVQEVQTLEERAVAVVEEVQHAPAPTTKIAGRVEKWPWVGECKDIMAFAKAIVEGRIPLYHDFGAGPVPAIMPNPEFGKYYAKRLEANAKFDGWEFKETLQSAQRSR